MKIVQNMMYLGFESKSSNKTGKSYLLVKTMEVETSSIYEWYVPSDKLTLVTAVGQLTPFSPVKIGLNMSSFNNKPQVDLENIQSTK